MTENGLPAAAEAPIVDQVAIDNDADSIKRTVAETYNKIQAEGVEKVRAEREAAPAKMPEYRPSKHDLSTEDGMRAEMAQAHQRTTALAKAHEANNPPLPWKGETLEETAEAQLAWSKLPLAERKQLSSFQKWLADTNKDAKELGVSPEEARAALRDFNKAQQANGTAQVDQLNAMYGERVKAIAPDRQVPEVVEDLIGLAERGKSDPEGVVREVARRLGVADPLANDSRVSQYLDDLEVQGAMHIAGGDTMAARAMVVDAFIAREGLSAPEVNAIAELLGNGTVKQTGHWIEDLRSGLKQVREQQGKGKGPKPKSWERTMRETGKRALAAR